jgi:hypothetical protein
MGVHTPIKIDLIRARDGDDCWLCGGKLDFNASNGAKKKPTREHIVATSNGGPNCIDNTVLCHFGCNKQLDNRPLVAKLKIRDKRRDNRLRQLWESEAKPREPVRPRQTMTARNDDHSRWHFAGWALALLFAGLSLGQWIG